MSNPALKSDRVRYAQVRLEGPRLRIHCALMILVMLLAVTGTVTYFMDWHEIRESSTDFGRGLVCAFTVDCDPSVFVGDSNEPRFTGVVTRDSGWDHSGASVPLLLLLVFCLAAFAARRPGFATSLAASVGMLALFAAVIVASFDLKHLFEHTVSLWAETVHAVAVIGLFFVSLASIVAQPVLYVTARREVLALRAQGAKAPKPEGKEPGPT